MSPTLYLLQCHIVQAPHRAAIEKNEKNDLLYTGPKFKIPASGPHTARLQVPNETTDADTRAPLALGETLDPKKDVKM